jgi:UDP-galactopyranose mutase
MEDVFFVGRLGTYMYYNMDQVVGQALATFKRIQEGVPKSRLPESREVRTSRHQHAAPAPG